MFSRPSLLQIVLLTTLALSARLARAEEWIQLKTFPRFILYVDSDSIIWRSEDEVEICQKTILTDAGKAYFREGYAKLQIQDEPPHAVVTRESYLRSRRRRSLSRMYLDATGNVTVRSDEPTELEPVPARSVYETVWVHLFTSAKPEPKDAQREVSRGAGSHKNLAENRWRINDEK